LASMNSMAIDRRSFLLGTVAAIAACPGAVAAVELAAEQRAVAFVSAAKRADGSFSILLLAADGAIIREVPLSDRGHDIALHPLTGRIVAFARRPGTFAVAIDAHGAVEPQIFTAQSGRHFYGHGAFSRDGQLLYVSENDIAGARGVIGIYDVASAYKKIGEHASFGLGPHEIILLADGQTLAVANGGLDTVPEAGRENLNLDAMEPSLAFIDAETGVLRARHAMPQDLKRLSIRHIAEDLRGRVWFGGQWEGDLTAAPPLIGFAGRDQPLQLIKGATSGALVPDAAGGLGLKGYIGSLAASRDGRIIAASAPKAGRIVYIDADTGAIAGESIFKDGCGVAGVDNAEFAVTSGFGAFRYETAHADVVSETQLRDLAFDNHLRRFG
jgi:uncharacterized protein